MLYPLSWLKDYLSENDLEDGGWTGEKIGRQIAVSFCEYEGREEIFFDFRGVVVGRILDIRPHENADKLSLTEVEVGKKRLKIVCGARNLMKGMLVPVALPGAKLNNGMVIKEMEVRGIKSEGMICAASELGLEHESEGIMDLGKGFRVGSSLDEVIDFGDELLDFSVPFNRPDAMSIRGMAKEISAVCGVKFYNDNFKVKEQSKEKIEDQLSVQVKDMAGCGRYSARIIDGVNISESPMWLKRRLIMAGMRPINAVVDVTNYVMLEYGQPMHAFDYDNIIGHNITVRRAKKGERIVTLDDQKKVLSAQDLVIADEKRILAMAGIIGGKDSGVLFNTKKIVLESANFSRKLINESSKNLGIQTDSSIRFGKGLPLSLTLEALDRAAYLIQKICGGLIVKGAMDVRSERILQRTVKLNYQNTDSFLGIEVPKVEVKKILKLLDFEIKKAGDDGVMVKVPDIRQDIEFEDDLIEEVGRVYGYNKIESQTFSMPVLLPRPELMRNYRNSFINYLANRGWSEVYSYNFVSGEDLERWGFDENESFKLINPVDKNLAYLRQSLVGGLAKKYLKWAKSGQRVALFEWGNVNNKGWKEKEQTLLGLIYNGEGSAKENFLLLKGTLEGMLSIGKRKMSDFQIARAAETDSDLDYLHPVNSLVVKNSKNQIVAVLGVIHPGVADELKMDNKTVYAQINLNKLVPELTKLFVYEDESKYPATKFDIAIVVDFKILSGELIREAKNKGGDLLRKVEIFDEFEIKAEIEPEVRKKSVGLRFIWQAKDRTLDDQEVEKRMQELIDYLGEKFQAELRGEISKK